MISSTHRPFSLGESFRKMEMQPIISGPLFFGAGIALVLAFIGDTLLFTAISLLFFLVLLAGGILAEMRLRHIYETKFIGSGAEGFSSLEKNTPYYTVASGNLEQHHWKFAIVSTHPREKELARFILTEEKFPDSFIKLGHEILPLKERNPGEQSKPIKGVVHKLDPDAVAASRPPQEHKRSFAK